MLTSFLFFQTTLQQFRKPEMSVVRQHEEFVWLHDRYVENDDYAGVIVSLDFRS
jgi:sorting nexin-5/6/32